MIRLWAISLMSLMTACGGRIESDSGTGGGTGTDGAGPDGSGEGGASAGPSGSPLGACEGGFERSVDGPPCNWVDGDDLCYSTKDEACNCICPRDRDSVCSSGFFRGEGNSTPVSCR